MSKPEKRLRFIYAKSVEERRQECQTIRAKYNDKIPIIVEPASNCDIVIDKSKYLTPDTMTVSEFLYVIRKKK